MRIAFLGSGRMGAEPALRLVDEHEVMAWNRNWDRTSCLAAVPTYVTTPRGDLRRLAVPVVTPWAGPSDFPAILVQR